MYSIPLSLLTKKSKFINESEVQNSQNFCKLFSKAKSSYEKKSEESKSIPKKIIPSNVWQWLENLPLDQKIQICTIKNKWLIKILIQLSYIHFFDQKTKFEPINEMNILFSNSKNLAILNQNLMMFQNNQNLKKKFGYNENDYYNIYFAMKKTEYIKKKSANTIVEEKSFENKFFNNILFLSLEDEYYLDSISLREDLLKDIKELKQIMNYFSNKECFKEPLEPIKYSYENCSYFYFPTWLHKQDLSFCEIITGIFEQQILLSYEYYLYSKKIYFFENSEIILDIYKENKNLENFFLNKNKTKEKIISIELIKEMISSIKSNVGSKKVLENSKKIHDQLYKDYYKTEFYIGDNVLKNEEENIYNDLMNEINNYKEKEKKINFLINKVTFMKFYDFGKFREFIFINLRKHFIEIMKKEIIDELLNATNNDENKTTKKKKKKKKKNKNNNSNNNINLCINENNFSSNDEHENNSINNNSSNSLKTKEIPEIKENKENIKKKEEKEKSKNKEFFLFSTNTKKNKNKKKINENNESISYLKSFSEKNNINMNYINKKLETEIKKEENNITINNITQEFKEEENKESLKKLMPQANNELYKETPTISFEMINSKKDKNENKIINEQFCINSPESATSFSFEASTKDKSKISEENILKDNINENKSPNQINMTINIINNQYIYQQYPFFNFNFNNFALMQSQFLYYYQVPSDEFLENLSKEIKVYESFTTKNIEVLDKIRKKYFIKIEKLIQSGLSKKYEIKFGHYGSFFTNLSIEGSDVDIRVYYKPLKPNLDFLKDIINLLNSHIKEFENINPILSASVPVIVLQINISHEINYDSLKYMPYFEKKDISHINIDLTFTSDEKEFKRPGEIVNYINKNVKNYEYIRPLLLVIKRYFRIMKMNKSFTGGLSSYSLFLLILAFLKNCEEKMNLGKLFYYFMEKYSFYDFKNYGIDVEGKEYYYPLENMINSSENEIKNLENFDDISEYARTEEIKILDPLTKLNVAKSSFRLDEIKNTFNKALYFLKFESWKYQNEEEDKIAEDDFTIIKKLFTIK